jgi:hypothetical protein
MQAKANKANPARIYMLLKKQVISCNGQKIICEPNLGYAISVLHLPNLRFLKIFFAFILGLEYEEHG